MSNSTAPSRTGSHRLAAAARGNARADLVSFAIVVIAPLVFWTAVIAVLTRWAGVELRPIGLAVFVAIAAAVLIAVWAALIGAREPAPDADD